MVGSVRVQPSLDPYWLVLWSWPPVFGILGNMCMLFPSHGFVTQQCPKWTESVSSRLFPVGNLALLALLAQSPSHWMWNSMKANIVNPTSISLQRGCVVSWVLTVCLLELTSIPAPGCVFQCSRSLSKLVCQKATTFSLLCLLGSLNSCGLEGVRFIVLLKPQNQFRVLTRRWRKRCVLRLRSRDAFFPLIWQTYVPP